MTYSAEHIAAYKRYEAAGWMLDSLADKDLNVLEKEDPNFRREVRCERERRTATTSLPPASTPSSRSTSRPCGTLAALDVEDVAEGMADAIVEHVIKARLVPMCERLAALEAQVKELRAQLGEDNASGTAIARLRDLNDRVKALEQRPELEYHGVYESGKTYKRNACVTHHGSVWIARRDTMAAPGWNTPDGRAWQLAVKAGRSAK